MINNGVPLHIVQRYAGHKTPMMTSRYAYIFDETMEREIAKYQGRIVDITGSVANTESTVADSPDLEWLSRNILAQALPNGSCALPAPQKKCPHANACFTCSHFRTTAEFLCEHKAQLEQTKKIIEKAKANGWQRQLEMNEEIKTNLENIISSLETGHAS